MKQKFLIQKFSLFVWAMITSIIAFGQLKELKFDNNIKISPSNLKVNLITEPSSNSKQAVEYKTGLPFGITLGFENADGMPTYFQGKMPLKLTNRLSLDQKAIQYVDYLRPMMKLQSQEIQFDLVAHQKDDLGFDHMRFSQEYKGVKIYGAEVIAHGKNGEFDFLNGNYRSSIDVNTIPTLDQDQAMAAMIQDRGTAVQYKNFMGPMAILMQDTKELVVFSYEGKDYLAYHITTYRHLAERMEYFVDAHTGNIIHKHESLCKLHKHKAVSDKMEDEAELFLPPNDGVATANALDLFDQNRTINTYQVGSTYYMIDGSRDIFSSAPSQLPNDPEGVIWTIDAFNTSPQNDNFKYDHIKSGNNAWNNKTGVSAHFNGGKAFEYFRNVHNRKSINGQGGNIISLINVADENGASMGNAFWNGQAMFYGNGDSDFKSLARGLDVAGHEMTHGVVQSTANLEYRGESGALNESFADIFGAMIDRDDWLIGEDVVKTSSFPSGALRSLQDPHNGGNSLGTPGYQPRVYSERYTGNQDEGGVHINSGIPNWAFFKFASAVGKEKAEKVYYRALSNYLTKSSKFVDCRVAVVKAATDLYGTAESDAAKKAFDEVGILGDSGGSYENDANLNPGQDLVLVTDLNNSGLYILDGQGTNLGKISNKGVLSKPSISDNGEHIIFVGKDNKMHYIFLDWSKNPVTPEEDIIGEEPIWRNAIISKDASKIAALTKQEDKKIIVIDVSNSQGATNEFELYNPTFTDGQKTGDVNYADAMEFDITGEYIMYDAENEINSLSSGSITYWDISFIKVWNNSSSTFSLGKVEKLFSSLPEGVSVGNPSFSKNSPYIIAFDYIDENGSTKVIGANTERGDSKLIFDNGTTIGYPNYSNNDKKLVFDALNSSSQKVVGISNLKTNKIEAQGDASLFASNRHWAVWFSNGERSLSSIGHVDSNVGAINLVSNPVSNTIEAEIISQKQFSGKLDLTDIMGKKIYSQDVFIDLGKNRFNVNASALASGTYLLTLTNKYGVSSIHVVKQ